MASNHNNVNFIAHITPKTEHYQDCISAIQGIVPATRAEAGCLRFELYESDNRTQLTLVERFIDQAAFDFHHQQAYTKQVFALYQEWLAKAVDIIAIKPL